MAGSSAFAAGRESGSGDVDAPAVGGAGSATVGGGVTGTSAEFAGGGGGTLPSGGAGLAQASERSVMSAAREDRDMGAA